MSATFHLEASSFCEGFAIFRPNAKTSRNRSGIAAVELAILVPFLVFLLVVSVDYARIFYYSVTVMNCARNGAVYASTDPTAAVSTDAIKTAAKKDGGNLNTANLTVSSTTDNNSNPTYVVVTVSYPFTTLTRYPGVSSSTTITRAVRMNVTPLIPN